MSPEKNSPRLSSVIDINISRLTDKVRAALQTSSDRVAMPATPKTTVQNEVIKIAFTCHRLKPKLVTASGLVPEIMSNPMDRINNSDLRVPKAKVLNDENLKGSALGLLGISSTCG
jgi:hypothetical protein